MRFISQAFIIQDAHQQQHDKYYDVLHQEDYKLQDQMVDSISFVALSNKDTMCWHQAVKQSDVSEFKKAVIKEFDDCCRNS